jgi:hypothetical protein
MNKRASRRGQTFQDGGKVVPGIAGGHEKGSDRFVRYKIPASS